MASCPLPDNVSEFIPRKGAEDWRGFPERRLCIHKNVVIGDFIPLATNGVMCVIEFLNGSMGTIHLENIEWPEKQRKESKRKIPTEPKVSKRPIGAGKLKLAAKSLGVSVEMLESLLTSLKV
jgi:hypothetical protein